MLSVLLLGTMAVQGAQEPDPATLLQRLARPAPAMTPFTEVRFSQLLDRPLIVSGTLEYAGKDDLIRHVTAPFDERTEIQGETVRVDRGRSHREISLSRVPELRSLVTGFGGLLSGDAAALEQDFRLSSSGDDAHWRLSLVPEDARIAQYVRTIEVTGAQDKPICIVTTEVRGNTSVLALQGPAELHFPMPLDRPTVDRYCRDGHL